MVLVPPIFGDVSVSKIAIPARRLADRQADQEARMRDGAVVGAVMLIELLPVIDRLVPGSKIIVADTPGAVVIDLLPPANVIPEKK